MLKAARILTGLILTAVTSVLSLSATAQTFDFSAEDFCKRFDRQLKDDSGDTIRSCKAEGRVTLCTFNDAKFQDSMRAFKAANLVNGHFALTETLTIETDAGRVQSIVLTGDRSNPMGIFHFAGQLGSLMRTLKPGMNFEDTAKLGLELGIMRGDADPTIGKPKVFIKDFAAVRCLSQPSRKSLLIGCHFVPRH